MVGIAAGEKLGLGVAGLTVRCRRGGGMGYTRKGVPLVEARANYRRKPVDAPRRGSHTRGPRRVGCGPGLRRGEHVARVHLAG